MKKIFLLFILLAGCNQPKIIHQINISGLSVCQYDNGMILVSDGAAGVYRSPEDWDLIYKKIQELSKIENDKKINDFR